MKTKKIQFVEKKSVMKFMMKLVVIVKRVAPIEHLIIHNLMNHHLEPLKVGLVKNKSVLKVMNHLKYHALHMSIHQKMLVHLIDAHGVQIIVVV